MVLAGARPPQGEAAEGRRSGSRRSCSRSTSATSATSSLIDRRLTPDLYSLVVAAKQTAGDDFALAVAETAREYPYADERSTTPRTTPLADGDRPRRGARLGRRRGWSAGCRGRRSSWRTLRAEAEAARDATSRLWKQRWNPYGMCSWPPEDDRIESFHRHVRDQAKAILGADLARSEKFTTSVMDGLDIRETLRNWHTGDLYVKVIPPSRGSIEVVVFLFDVPADPRGLHQPRDLVRRARRGIDAGLLRHRPDDEPGRPRDRAGRVRRGAVPLPAPADPRHLDRPPARLRRHAGGAAPGRRLPAQPRAARRRRQPQAAPGVAGGGWRGGSAGRSSTCR